MPSRDRDKELQELLEIVHQNGISTELWHEPPQQHPTYELKIITTESGTDSCNAHA